MGRDQNEAFGLRKLAVRREGRRGGLDVAAIFAMDLYAVEREQHSGGVILANRTDIMKRSILWLVVFGQFFVGQIFAQLRPTVPEWQSMKIIQTEEPIFPIQLQQLSITEGEARVVINVGPDGKLNEWLVVGYTMPEFADVAVRSIRQWQYEPARLRGDPVGATTELVFHFETHGTLVVSQTIVENLEAQVLRVLAHAYSFRYYVLKELDRIPTPIYTISPPYSRELADKGVKGKVAIDFFIDQSGAVRMPAGSATDDARLSGLAIAALRQWKFEPPTHNGRPVLAQATQVFNFSGTGDGR